MQVTPRISPEFESILPHLTIEEYTSLQFSLKSRGLQFPIVIDQDGVLLDGHHRLKACKELGIEPNFQVHDFIDKEDRLRFILETNLGRRMLRSDFARVLAAQPLLKIEREKALQREREGHSKKLAPIGTRIRGKSIALVAKMIGVKPRTFERIQFLIDNKCEYILSQLERGLISSAKAYELANQKSTATVENQSVSQDIELQGALDSMNDLESNELNLASKRSLDDLVACAGCKKETTRAKTKLTRLCEDCRRVVGVNW
jgi:ParB-like chromosome segregation protein Spo0J